MLFDLLFLNNSNKQLHLQLQIQLKLIIYNRNSNYNYYNSYYKYNYNHNNHSSDRWVPFQCLQLITVFTRIPRHAHRGRKFRP